MLVTLMLFSLQAASVPADSTIVVTGRKNVTPEYQVCLKGGCDPTRDANVSLAYAQQQLLAGDYRGSRRALQAAIKRNAGAARSHPQALNALYDGDSTIALHIGDQEAARRSGLKAIAVIRDAYGDSDQRSILARARIGAVEERVGRLDDADRAYRSAAEDARGAGLKLLAETLDLRRAALLSKRGQTAAAQSQVTRMAENADLHPKLRLQAAVLAARIATERSDTDTAQRMITLIGSQSTDAAPTLISASPIEIDAETAALKHAEKFGGSSGMEPRSMDSKPLLWVDVGYWIRPDGSVDEVEILRGSETRDWTKPIVRSISTRRYAQFAAPAGDPGKFRIERFTLTADWVTPVGSKIRRRAGANKLRTIDITRDPDIKVEHQQGVVL